MDIAIIGGGISGLTAAYYLRPCHSVTLIEANDYVGGHTNTVDVELDGQEYAIDTGFIVFNDRTYPNYCRLLGALRVASQPTSMSFSVRCDRLGLEYRGADLNGLFAQRRNLVNPNFYRLIGDIFRFNRRATELFDELDESLTVSDFFRRERFSEAFLQYYFLPMGSAIWSCPRGQFEQFPIRFIIEFYRHHGLLSVRNRPQWRVIRGGSRNYVKAMIRGFSDNILTGCRVTSVVRDPEGVDVYTDNWRRRFDHVVFACHSDQALAILGRDATSLERELLSAIPYERNVAVLHTDESLLPRCRRAWASWNYHLPFAGGEHGTEKTTVTYNLNILQGLTSPHVFCVTLNGEPHIKPERIIQRMVYHHPVFTVGRAAVQRRHPELIDQFHTSFCGAYWGNGFHEDGVKSALAVCEVLNHSPQSAAGPTNLRRAVSPG